MLLWWKKCPNSWRFCRNPKIHSTVFLRCRRWSSDLYHMTCLFSWSLGISNKMMVKNGKYMTCIKKKNIRIDDFQFHEGLYHMYAYYFRVAKFLRQIPSPSNLDLFGAILWCKRWMSWCCSRYVHWLEGRGVLTTVKAARMLRDLHDFTKNWSGSLEGSCTIKRIERHAHSPWMLESLV